MCINSRILGHELSTRLEISGSNYAIESNSGVEFGSIRVLSKRDEVPDL